jgi:hypothetical protein
MNALDKLLTEKKLKLPVLEFDIYNNTENILAEITNVQTHLKTFFKTLIQTVMYVVSRN